jgi:hypothetical protein
MPNEEQVLNLARNYLKRGLKNAVSAKVGGYFSANK